MRDIEFTAENQVQTLKDQIFEAYNVEDITMQLRNQSAENTTPDELKLQKRVLWNQIRLFAFIRMILGLYMVTLHAEFTTILISIFGRFDYLDSLDSIENTENSLIDTDGLPVFDESYLVSEPSISDDTRRRFLTISWYILHQGWRTISTIVEDAVQNSMQEYLRIT